VSVFNYLVSSNDETYVMFLAKTRHNIRTESEARFDAFSVAIIAAIILRPSCYICVWVTVEKIAYEPRTGYLEQIVNIEGYINQILKHIMCLDASRPGTRDGGKHGDDVHQLDV
jgi:hypothetical protein